MYKHFNLMYVRSPEHLSVPQALRTVLASNNVYLQALSSGIANYTALAQKIKTEVEKITGIEVQLGTIVVAVKRFADTLNKEQQEKDKLIINYSLQGARMSLTGSIIDVDFEDRGFDEISNILDEFFEKESGSYNVLFLVSDILHDNQIPLHNAFFDRNEIVLILNDEDAAKAYELLRAKMSTQ